MPPKKRKAVSQRATPSLERRAALPVAQAASRAATRKAAPAATTKANLRAQRPTSSSNATARTASSRKSAKTSASRPTAEKAATSRVRGRESSPPPPPPIATTAAFEAAPALITRPHRRCANVKQPPRADEANDSGISSSETEKKARQADRKDAHDDAEARHTVAMAIDGDEAILFRSGVAFAGSTDATSSDDGACQRHRDAPPALPRPSIVVSSAAAVEHDFAASPEASATDPLCLFGRGSGNAEGGGGSSSSATLDLRRCSTPPPLSQPAGHGTQVRTPEGSSKGGSSVSRQSTESSPEALTANSESKPSGHRWKRQLFAAATPATQLLREGDEGEEKRLKDGVDSHGGTSPTHAAVTVRQLFTQPARSISLTPTSAGDSPNGTLAMSCGNEEDGLGEANAQWLHRRQDQFHQHPPHPPGVSSIATGSDSESQWSGGWCAEEPRLPPGSATAATPPPLSSLVSCVSSAGGVQLLHQHHLHNSGRSTDELDRSTSMRPLPTQSSAGNDDGALPSLQARVAASAAQSFPPPAGHLRMGGSTSRQRSPTSSSYTWLKRVAGGGEVELCHPPTPPSSAAPLPFPTHPPVQQQQQWSSYAHPRLNFTSPSSSQLSQLADMEVPTEVNTNAEGGHAPTATTPGRLRLREPPVWRTPQIAQLPKSLSVSPASLRGEDRGGAVKADAALPPTPSLPRAQLGAPSASSDLSSTAAATQTLTQASANAVGGSQAPLHVVPSGPSAAPAAGRPSTQLVTKAAATRPRASPGTMWICLDDDDDDDGDGSQGEGGTEKGETSTPPHNGAGAPLVSVKREIGAEADGEHMDAVFALPGHTAAAGASPSPSRLPAEEGMAAGVEEAETHGKLRSRRSSSSKADSGGGGGSWVDHLSFPVSSPEQARRRSLAEKSHPIAEILSPTFRPRRRPSDPCADLALSLGSGNATDQRPSGQSAPHCYINLDDDTEESGEDVDDAPPRQRARGAPAHDLAAYSARAVSTGAIAGAGSPLSLPLIIDDDDDDDTEWESETCVRRSGDGVGSYGLPPKLPKAERGTRVVGRSQVAAGEAADDAELPRSPQRPHVKDFIFPNRLDPELRPSSPLYRSIHAYQQQQQHQQLTQENEEEGHTARHVAAASLPKEGVSAECHHSPQRAANIFPASGTKNVSNDSVAAAGHAGRKRGRAKDTKAGAAVLTPVLPDWGRPADTLLRDFFPTKFTKKGFMEAAKTVMSPMHFLDAGSFWAAFTSAEFVGEGSFGLVWRCTTVDGDLVAVKSCPIVLRSKSCIEDSFATIREIATLRFLNEMQVPYILPLHSAFLVQGQEALPPMAQEALEWRRQLRKRAEDAALEKEVKLLTRGAQRRASDTLAEEDAADAPLTLEQQIAVQMELLSVAEGPEERATRARLQAVRLPRFLSITYDDLAQSDATVFLVTELCDGDVEGISRSDGIAKGMVYCVSSALAAMHELGLLHLDLKPSNILFAYEHGPSQQRLQPHQALGAPSATADAVKFYLSDFGNCRLVGPKPMDEVQAAYGTFEYMDLRALRDAVCGRPTDAFSLGATLYELLYGKRLYPKCLNPRCGRSGQEEHSRECFVEAASRPLVLPAGEPLAAASGPSLPPLQYLTLALLRQPWAERMTAEECRRYIVRTFHITQTADLSS
ncbi:hypothetical protein LSCM1_07081 [Leishmania martiniquensis]|uniref:Protein kinase domain-containing protein n=1 Tax=Leishmania martiniquensis TaxID=1580590 RepID=A0A836KS84_9TRYP|nr:hypothetical protein LSCM1_07081 [Leishmania martiniquensis]